MREPIYAAMEKARSGDPTFGVAEGLEQLRRGIEWSRGRGSFTLIYRFPRGTTAKSPDFVDALWACYNRGSVLVKIEEVWFCAHPNYMPPVLEEVCFTGRHRQLGLIFTSQRPGRVNKNLLASCEHKFFGRIDEKNALAYLADELGEDIVKLPTLEPYHFLWKRQGAPAAIVRSR